MKKSAKIKSKTYKTNHTNVHVFLSDKINNLEKKNKNLEDQIVILKEKNKNLENQIVNLANSLKRMKSVRKNNKKS